MIVPQPEKDTLTLPHGPGIRHPDVHPGEMFLTYANHAGFAQIDVPGKRFGERCFACDGRDVTELARQLNIRPVFVNRAAWAARYKK